MGTKVEYVDSTQLYATNYIRNSKAIAVLWSIFSICYAIISIVAFVTPEWVGDIDSTETGGRLGLWQICHKDQMMDSCSGKLENLFAMPTFSFRFATIAGGCAVIASLLTIACLIFMLFLKSTTVFLICGWVQLFSAVSMVVACAAFPFGWNSDEFRKICGPESNRFELGLCSIRWAYPLGIIACVDGIILSTLAFILATRHVRLQPDPTYQSSSVYKGEINNAYLTAESMSHSGGSRKSLNLQPVLLVSPPHHMTASEDTLSQFSSRTATRFRPDFHNSMHQFQL